MYDSNQSTFIFKIEVLTPLEYPNFLIFSAPARSLCCIYNRMVDWVNQSDGGTSEQGQDGTENGDWWRGGEPLIFLQNRLHILVCVFAFLMWRESFENKVTCFPFWCPLEHSNESHSYKYVEWEENPTSTAQDTVVPPPDQLQLGLPLFVPYLCNCVHARIWCHKNITYTISITCTEICWIPPLYVR